jgi:hypothetical protein
VLDRAYEVLRSSGSWRPLVREVREDGSEEIRVGSWASLRADGDRLRLILKEGAGSPSDAARLALELSSAGFAVDVETAPRERRSH